MEQFKAVVKDLSSDGLGVVDHPDGKVFFVPGTWPEDEGEFEVVSEKKRFGIARVVQITKPSPQRREPACPHWGLQAGKCGGCPWIIADYPSQLLQKQKRVEYLVQQNNLLRAEGKLLPILASNKEFGYRNRAQLKTNGKQLGYVSPGTKTIADIESCLVLTDQLQQQLHELRQTLPNRNWSATGKFLWNFIDINTETKADSIRPNQRQVFAQGNDGQNSKMKSWLRDRLNSSARSATVIELFAGSGNFTQEISSMGFAKVYCAEIDQVAVNQLKKQSLINVEGFVVDLYKKSTWHQLPQPIKEAEILFLDPPREGFTLLSEFIESLPNLKKVIYISCDPFSWAKDIKPLIEGSWTLQEVQPLDLFPQTPHIEILSLLER